LLEEVESIDHQMPTYEGVAVVSVVEKTEAAVEEEGGTSPDLLVYCLRL
jgi:hypothetical protein